MEGLILKVYFEILDYFRETIFIRLKTLANGIGAEIEAVEPVVKNLIAEGKIGAKYDENRKIIRLKSRLNPEDYFIDAEIGTFRRDWKVFFSNLGWGFLDSSVVRYIRNIIGGTLSIALFGVIIYFLGIYGVFTFIGEAYHELYIDFNLWSFVLTLVYSFLILMGFSIVAGISGIPAQIIGDFEEDNNTRKKRNHRKNNVERIRWQKNYSLIYKKITSLEKQRISSKQQIDENFLLAFNNIKSAIKELNAPDFIKFVPIQLSEKFQQDFDVFELNYNLKVRAFNLEFHRLSEQIKQEFGKGNYELTLELYAGIKKNLNIYKNDLGEDYIISQVLLDNIKMSKFCLKFQDRRKKLIEQLNKGEISEVFNEYKNLQEEISLLEKNDTIPSLILKQFADEYEQVEIQYEIWLSGVKDKINGLIEEVDEELEADNFEDSRAKLSEAENLFERIKRELLQTFSVDFGSVHERIESAEDEYMIYSKLLKFANRFPRIHLTEITENVEIKTERIVQIIKNLIVRGKIHGKYDEETRGIEFTFAADEIDHLLKTYKEWESRKHAKN